MVQSMIICLLLAYLLTPASSTEVLDWMARLPVTETAQRSGHWDRVGSATKIAEAIAEVAPDRRTAAEMTVYAVFEGGNRACAVGDGGKSLGPFQEQRVPASVACDPRQAAAIWLTRAAQSRIDCAALPENEQLAALSSGNCGHGHVVSRRRDALAKGLLGP
jgi:hypothetical protein